MKPTKHNEYSSLHVSDSLETVIVAATFADSVVGHIRNVSTRPALPANVKQRCTPCSNRNLLKLSAIGRACGCPQTQWSRFRSYHSLCFATSEYFPRRPPSLWPYVVLCPHHLV